LICFNQELKKFPYFLIFVLISKIYKSGGENSILLFSLFTLQVLKKHKIKGKEGIFVIILIRVTEEGLVTFE